MLIRYWIILILIFFGMMVGKYQVFPYDELRYMNNIIINLKNHLIHIPMIWHPQKLSAYDYFQHKNKTIDFRKNVNCVENINSSFNGKDETPDYTFFIAGHTYSKNLGLNKPFYLDVLNSKEKFSFGILAGDVVRENTENSWSFLKKQIGNLDYKIYISPGNHDLNTRFGDVGKEFIESKYGKTYYKFIKNKDLFIILDSNISRSNILDEQLDFFKKTLNENYKTVKNIFIISHHLIYLDKNRAPFSEVVPNGDIPDTNFWQTLYPLLENFNNNIFIISGDTGNYSGKELFCHKSRNITFLATGMPGALSPGVGRSMHYLIIESINQIIKMRVKEI
jgi:hypothetical protein